MGESWVDGIEAEVEKWRASQDGDMSALLKQHGATEDTAVVEARLRATVAKVREIANEAETVGGSRELRMADRLCVFSLAIGEDMLDFTNDNVKGAVQQALLLGQTIAEAVLMLAHQKGLKF